MTFAEKGNHHIRLNPSIWGAYDGRGWLYGERASYDKAASDFARAAALVDAARTANPSEDLEKGAKAIRDARQELELDRDLEKLWVDYLKQIEAAGAEAYRNWTGPPGTLYAKDHELKVSQPVEPVPRIAGATAPSRSRLAKGVLFHRHTPSRPGRPAVPIIPHSPGRDRKGEEAAIVPGIRLHREIGDERPKAPPTTVGG